MEQEAVNTGTVIRRIPHLFASLANLARTKTLLRRYRHGHGGIIPRRAFVDFEKFGKLRLRHA